MDVQINVDEAIAKIKKNFEQLSEKEIKAATTAAINRSLAYGKTEGVRQIKAAYNIKQAMIQEAITTTKATSGLMIGNIGASTKPISLVHFQPTFSFNKRSKTSYNKAGIGATKLLKRKSSLYKQGVTVEIIKGQKSTLPYAFMIAGKKPIFARGAYATGGTGGFIRRHKRVSATGSDTPITSMVTITPFGSLTNTKVMPTVEPKVEKKFEERMLHELNYRLSKVQA